MEVLWKTDRLFQLRQVMDFPIATEAIGKVSKAAKIALQPDVFTKYAGVLCSCVFGVT